MHDTVGTRALTPPLHWGDPPLTDNRPGEPDLLLPVGTVTLLAGIAGSSRTWEAGAESRAAALPRLDEVVADAVGRRGGVRPLEQGDGDSFVAAFARATDAVACALDLQRANRDTIGMRIAVHTGEVQLRDQGHYMGATVNRCSRLRDLAYAGQTILSQVTHDLVVEGLPDGAWLKDLGSHRLRDLARPEQVYQLCHPDTENAFPALRSLDSRPHNLPIQLTSFVGRRAELADIAGMLRDARLLTLTGSGGCGKTRLALQVAADVLADHSGGVWFVDLAPVLDGDLLAMTVARAMRLPDAPERLPAETVVHHVGSTPTLILLDNCEHVVAGCAQLAETLLRSCPGLSILATSREPLGTPGEIAWRIPPLTLPAHADAPVIAAVTAAEAVQLFADRARRARPAFEIGDANAAAVVEICRRLDGIPLAIELAAARVRVLSADEIAKGLHDQFRMLAGGARTAVPRQQTLRASVDWSHDLLTAPERTLFRRLGAFAGSFDLPAAEVVCAGDGLEPHQVLDQLSLLVDKSLVLAVDAGDESRYRLLETVRQYALERLHASGELDTVRLRHRDHYLGFAEAAAQRLEHPREAHWLGRLAGELANLHAAFLLSRQRGDTEQALRIAAAPFLLWWLHARVSEGAAWLDDALAESAGVDPAVLVHALTVRTYLWAIGDWSRPSPAGELVSLARSTGDRRLLARALVAANRPGMLYEHDRIASSLREGIDLAREVGDTFTLLDGLLQLGVSGALAGQPGARLLIEESCALAAASGAAFTLRANTALVAYVMVFLEGDLAGGRAIMEPAFAEARATGDRRAHLPALSLLTYALTMLGELETARSACMELIEIARDMGMPLMESLGHFHLGVCELACGDAVAAREALRRGWTVISWPLFADAYRAHGVDAELLCGDVASARRMAGEALTRTTQTRNRCFHGWSLIASARVAVAEGFFARAEDEAHDALSDLVSTGNQTGVCDALELIGRLAAGQESHREAVRLYAAADAQRARTGYVRFAVHERWYRPSLAALRGAMGEEAFVTTWSEGGALSLGDAVAYATRGRGERRRPPTGWDSLTPAELSVARLVAGGMANKEVAQRLFISPRTVQAHLSHIFTKLDVVSRVQLANEAARHPEPGASAPT